MPDYNLRIIVETIKKGVGAQTSQREVDQLGRKLNTFATQADRAGIRSAALEQKTQKLARQVAKGKISVDKAAQSLAKFRDSLPVEEMDEAGDSAGGFLGKLGGGGLGTLAKFTGAVGLVGVAAKKAFDFGQAGSSLAQLQESFESVNERIFKTPDLLEDMRIASRNTITDVQIMSGVMTLAAGASDELASELAQASPKLLEIAKAASKVNPLLGDTAFLYESIALGVKRGSPLILDNLGIMVKVGEANRKYAEELGKTVAQLSVQDKQMALLNETIRAGDALIEQAGGNVDAQGDAYAQLSTRIGQFKDDAAKLAHTLVGPLVAGFVGVTAEAQVAQIALDDWLAEDDFKNIEDYQKKLKELENDIRRIGGLRFTLSPFAAEANVVQIETGIKFVSQALHDMNVASDDLVGMQTRLREIGVETDNLGGHIEGVPFSFIQLAAALRRLEAERFARGLADADKAMLQYGRSTEPAVEGTEKVSEEMEKLKKQIDNIEFKQLLDDTGFTTDSFAMLAFRLGGAAAATELLRKKQKEARKDTEDLVSTTGLLDEVYKNVAARAATAVGAFNSVIDGGLSLMNEEMDELGPKMVTWGGRTADQNRLLGQMEDEVKGLNRQIADAQAAPELFGGAEDANKKIEEATERINELSPALERLSRIQGTAGLANIEFSVDQAALTEAFYEQSRALLADEEALLRYGLSADEAVDKALALGLATGELNDEQAAAILKQLELNAGVDALSEAYGRNLVSAGQAAEALKILGTEGLTAMQDFIRGLHTQLGPLNEAIAGLGADLPEIEIEADIVPALTEVNTLKGELDELVGSIEFRHMSPADQAEIRGQLASVEETMALAIALDVAGAEETLTNFDGDVTEFIEAEHIATLEADATEALREVDGLVDEANTATENPYVLEMQADTVLAEEEITRLRRAADRAAGNRVLTFTIKTEGTIPDGGTRHTGGNIEPGALYRVQKDELFMSNVAGQITKTAPTTPTTDGSQVIQPGGQAAAAQGGDTYNQFYPQTEAAMALALAQVHNNKRERINRYMGG